MTARQSRLLRLWVSEVGLDPKKHSIESLRRTKAVHMLNGIGDLEAVRLLLGHSKLESTARYLLCPKGQTQSQFLKLLISCGALEC